MISLGNENSHRIRDIGWIRDTCLRSARDAMTILPGVTHPSYKLTGVLHVDVEERGCATTRVATEFWQWVVDWWTGGLSERRGGTTSSPQFSYYEQ